MRTSPFWAIATNVTSAEPPLDFQVSLEDMISETGRLIDGDLSHYEANGTRFQTGDVLFGKLRPYLAKYWLADREGTAGGDIHVYRPEPGVNSRYLAYVVGSRNFVRFAEAASKGTKMPRAEWMSLREYPVLQFDEDVQCEIADYLDDETHGIDVMVGKLEELSVLLKIRRVNAVRVHLKGFPKVALGIHCSIANGSTPLRTRNDYWTEEGGVPWLNSAAVNQKVVLEASRQVTASAIKECHLPMVIPGDLLIGITGQGRTRGMMAKSGIESTISQHVAAIRPNSGWDERFLYHALDADYLELRQQSEGSGSTKGAITCEMLSRYRTPLPPLRSEQVRIADHLDVVTAKIDAMLAKAAALKSLLLERRAALITDVVTGRKAVA